MKFEFTDEQLKTTNISHNKIKKMFPNYMEYGEVITIQTNPTAYISVAADFEEGIFENKQELIKSLHNTIAERLKEIPENAKINVHEDEDILLIRTVDDFPCDIVETPYNIINRAYNEFIEQLKEYKKRNEAEINADKIRQMMKNPDVRKIILNELKEK